AGRAVDAERRGEIGGGPVAGTERRRRPATGEVGALVEQVVGAVAVGVVDAAHRAGAAGAGSDGVLVPQRAAGHSVGGVVAADRAGGVGGRVQIAGIVGEADGIAVE